MIIERTVFEVSILHQVPPKKDDVKKRGVGKQQADPATKKRPAARQSSTPGLQSRAQSSSALSTPRAGSKPKPGADTEQSAAPAQKQAQAR